MACGRHNAVRGDVRRLSEAKYRDISWRIRKGREVEI